MKYTPATWSLEFPHLSSPLTPELGGTGRPHDWAVGAEFVEASQLPVFLAGGLSPSNVADAIRQVRPDTLFFIIDMTDENESFNE